MHIIKLVLNGANIPLVPWSQWVVFEWRTLYFLQWPFLVFDIP